MRNQRQTLNKKVIADLDDFAVFTKAQPERAEELFPYVVNYLKQTVSGQDYVKYMNYFKIKIGERK